MLQLVPDELLTYSSSYNSFCSMTPYSLHDLRSLFCCPLTLANSCFPKWDLQLNSIGSFFLFLPHSEYITSGCWREKQHLCHLKHLCVAVECYVGLSDLPVENQWKNVLLLLYLEEKDVFVHSSTYNPKGSCTAEYPSISQAYFKETSSN